MFISSRTPEGQPNHCPVCQADVCIEPSPLFGDATCPRCGSLLWFFNTPSQSFVRKQAGSDQIQERLIAYLAEQLGVEPSRITEDTSLEGLDSLDITELVMELEAELN